MIINLAGSGGSGKSYVALKLIKEYKLEPRFGYKYRTGEPPVRRSKRPTFYQGQFSPGRNGKELIVLGGYNSMCGGMDGIGTIDKAVELIDYAARQFPKAIILYESLMIGKSVGAVGAMVKANFNDRHIKAFLDTPLDVCIKRVNARRITAGNQKPLDPKNLILDHRALQASRRNSEAFGLTCVDINYKHAYDAIVAIMKRGKL